MLENYDDQGHSLVFTQYQAEDLETWKFACPLCGFRGIYVIDISNGKRELEITDRGDAEALHYSDTLISLLLEGFVWRRPSHEEHFDWENWLNPVIRQKLNKIAASLDD